MKRFCLKQGICLRRGRHLANPAPEGGGVGPHGCKGFIESVVISYSNAEMCHISVLKLFILSVPIIILHLLCVKRISSKS